ncbi:MAG: ergothioneine biosynthesis protein EgtB [Alcanivoracaceae bacterium]|nr:ergothioneine biosynthesis protein EgtB [Alcanivoracaceae bacterium]
MTSSLPPDISQSLLQRFTSVRQRSVDYCAPLHPEDCNLQAMPETSPAKWHLAHTAWFFETFLLKPYLRDYQRFHDRFEYLFNSYYNGVGSQYPRARRGLLSRPALDEVLHYRLHVDQAMTTLLSQIDHPAREDIIRRTELGMHHEYQHQELFFTDIKYNLACNPLAPQYRPHEGLAPSAEPADAIQWQSFNAGLISIGSDAQNGFVFDNETPVHQRFLAPFQLASRPVCNAEVLAFINDGGYRTPSLWLADGWAKVQQEQWQHPLYWQQHDNQWQVFTLHGLAGLNPADTAVHLSAYEADAIARWLGARLPDEAEWELAAQSLPVQGHFLSGNGLLQPGSADGTPLSQMFGSVWEWTASSYAPYPGYRAAAGALGEYNGKFMCNQLVLRGGSCVSDREQLRPSYRNFFYPPDRWQFSGLRLARDGNNT